MEEEKYLEEVSLRKKKYYYLRYSFFLFLILTAYAFIDIFFIDNGFFKGHEELFFFAYIAGNLWIIQDYFIYKLQDMSLVPINMKLGFVGFNIASMGQYFGWW